MIKIMKCLDRYSGVDITVGKEYPVIEECAFWYTVRTNDGYLWNAPKGFFEEVPIESNTIPVENPLWGMTSSEFKKTIPEDYRRDLLNNPQERIRTYLTGEWGVIPTPKPARTVEISPFEMWEHKTSKEILDDVKAEMQKLVSKPLYNADNVTAEVPIQVGDMVSVDKDGKLTKTKELVRKNVPLKEFHLNSAPIFHNFDETAEYEMSTTFDPSPAPWTEAKVQYERPIEESFGIAIRTSSLPPKHPNCQNIRIEPFRQESDPYELRPIDAESLFPQQLGRARRPGQTDAELIKAHYSDIGPYGKFGNDDLSQRMNKRMIERDGEPQPIVDLLPPKPDIRGASLLNACAMVETQMKPRGTGKW